VRAVALAAIAAALGPFAVADLVAVLPRRRRRPAVLVPLLARLGRRLGAPAAPRDLAARLAAAGMADRVRPADAMAVKAGAAVAALLASAGPASALPGRLGPVALVASPAAGFLAPDAWLRRRARRRGARMAAELADVLDLLRVAVEAGLAPARALREVGHRHRGLLGSELRAAARRIALGVPHGEALDALEARCPLPAVTTLVAALRRAERHGAPLAPALVSLAADARAERTRALRDRAAKAGPKIQLVIALLLVPAVLLLVGAALAGSLLT
jgi:tight adherence protein C